jgi:hypothetical protein
MASCGEPNRKDLPQAETPIEKLQGSGAVLNSQERKPRWASYGAAVVAGILLAFALATLGSFFGHH